MPTTVEAVNRHLETDLVLHQALERGVLNLRETARWLIETREWDTTEEAVVSALRRHDGDTRADLEQALAILDEAEVGVMTGLALVTIPRVHEIVGRLPALVKALEPEDTLAILPGARRVRIAVDRRRLDVVESKLGADSIDELVDGLARARLRLGETGTDAMAALAVWLNLLAHHGVDVEEVFGCLPECSVLVPEDQIVQTCEVVSDTPGRA